PPSSTTKIPSAPPRPSPPGPPLPSSHPPPPGEEGDCKAKDGDSASPEGGRPLAQGVSPGNDSPVNPARGDRTSALTGLEIYFPAYPGLTPWVRSLPPSGLALPAVRFSCCCSLPFSPGGVGNHRFRLRAVAGGIGALTPSPPPPDRASSPSSLATVASARR